MPSAAPNSATGPAPTPAPGRARAARFLRRHWANLLAGAMILIVIAGYGTEVWPQPKWDPPGAFPLGLLPWTANAETASLTAEALGPAHHSPAVAWLADPLGTILDSRVAALLDSRGDWLRYARGAYPRQVAAHLLRLAAMFGLFASFWYVARKLYGPAGALVGLGVLLTSPVVEGMALLPAPIAIFCWGVFGAVFCAVATAHTLYAPRPVILWNWKRILMLGGSLALAIACDYIFLLLIPVLLAILWYLAPVRRGAATVLLAGACGVAAVIMAALYGFNPSAGAEALRQMAPFQKSNIFGAGFEVEWAQSSLGPVAQALAVASLIVALAWRRARYFGNLGPLAIAASLTLAALFLPVNQAIALWFAAIPFLCQAIGGVAADLLETRARRWLAPALALALGLQAYLTFSSYY